MESDEQREIEDLLSRGSAARFGRRGRKSLYEAPEFTKRLSAFTEASAGNNVTFECQFKGFPRPTLRWYRDDELVPGDERYVYEESDGYASLSISKVGKFDEAAYKCKAENSEGVTSTTGYLSVTGDLSDKPLSCQGRQSEHAVSNPPPLRTIIEQKSMEEREEDAYPQLSTSPVDEILQEAALKGHGWPAMLGLKKKRGRRPRQPNDEENDSGSDTSVESQQDDRLDRETTPDADLVIDEGNLLPYDGPFQPQGEMMQTSNNVNPNMASEVGAMTNGAMATEQQQQTNGVSESEQQNQEYLQHQQATQQSDLPLDPNQIHLQDQNQVQPQDLNQMQPQDLNQMHQMEDTSVNQDPQAPGLCQAPFNQSYPGIEVQPDPEQKNGFAQLPEPPSYSQVMEDNIIPDMQTAPAMAAPNAPEMGFNQPPPEMGQPGTTQEVQPSMIQEVQQPGMYQEVQPRLVQGFSTEPQIPEEISMHDSGQFEPQVQVGLMEVTETEIVPTSLTGDGNQQENAQVTLMQEAMSQQPLESQTQMQAELTQSSEGISGEESGGTNKPETEKQKSMESGYSTEDLEAAIQHEAGATFTETVEIPIVKASPKQPEGDQQASIVVGDAGQTTPEVMLGSPVNLQLSLSGSPGELGALPIGFEVQQSTPEVMDQQPISALHQVYEAPANFSLTSAEVRHDQQQLEEPNQVHFVSSVSSEITEPQVLPQTTETVMSQHEPPLVEQSQGNTDDDSQYSSASNPFRSTTPNTNEEMLASYTRTFSSTIEEEEKAQEVGDPLISGEPIVRHTDEIVTMAAVQTTRPHHDWLPFPWLPMSFLVTVSSFLAVAFEISPSTMVLLLFFISLISFRFIVSRVEPKKD